MARKSGKITIKRRLDDEIASIPESERSAVVLAAIRAMGPIFPAPQYEVCPVCGDRRMPVEFRNKWRRCGNCCHYEEQNATAERKLEIEAESRRWMQIHHRPIISRAAGAA